jgi:CHAT domain-containing protein
MLAAAHVDIHAGADPEMLERERALQADITAKSERRIHLLAEKHAEEKTKELENEVADLTAEYQDVEARLRVASPSYASLTQPEPLAAAEIRAQVLDPDTLLLEYSLGGVHSHVFALTFDSLQVFELPARSAVEKTARRLHALLTARNREVAGETPAEKEQRWRKADAACPRTARELSRMILGPVAGRLKGKRLVIVADGALHYIPFAALPEPSSGKPFPEPLAVQHEIVSLPSASVLALLRQQHKDRGLSPQAVAVFADPVFDKNDPRVSQAAESVRPGAPRETPATERLPVSPEHLEFLTRSAADLGLKRHGELYLPRLRYSRREAEAIRALVQPSQVLEAVDFRASRAAGTSPELANYRIVHFATHALLNNQHPDLSGLVLSLVDEHGGAQDGFLTLHDIYNMSLRAELVVLSACETALGKEIGGEGLIGLTRGFMYAGANRVVASLWSVSDATTAQLMTEFYLGMERDGLSPAAALRSAQVKMWRHKRWRSPYYWSAFQIQGEWR